MVKTPKVLILRTAGTNCDVETAHGFRLAGGDPHLVHINEFLRGRKMLSQYEIMAVPGGFSYGDDIAAGKILANEIKYLLSAEIKKFAADGKPVIGICNGFQVLVKTGLLPGFSRDLEQETTLTFNDSGKFEDRWVYLKSTVHGPRSTAKCIWTKNLPEVIYLPVAHGEGKFIAKDKETLKKIEENNQVAFRYVNEQGESAPYPWNPNASVNDIAGISNKEGTILGLMPHPERYLAKFNHPRWTREELPEEGFGLTMFKNAIKYTQKGG